jgi:SAM-dependent methyltransferase
MVHMGINEVTEKTRVYHEEINLNPSSVLEFFETRGDKFDPEKPLVSVLYQDQNPSLAKERDQYEKNFILPQLQLTGNERVLDVGCGIGRWADVLAPKVTTYCGVDFSPKFIAIAKERFHSIKNANFQVLGAEQIGVESFFEERFDLILISGLLLYLNDDQLERCLKGVASLASASCTLYVREPLCAESRLTLNAFESVELKQEYSAIYRSASAMQGYLDAAFSADSFESSIFKPLYQSDALNNRSDTKQYYLIVKRRP